MAEIIQCWRCGEVLKNLILPLSRREECAECGAEQHVCRLCKHDRPGLSYGCHEDLAEELSDKESANFCDYFKPNPNAYRPKTQSKQAQAEAELAALFSSSVTNTPSTDAAQSKKDQSLSELEKLFGNP